MMACLGPRRRRSCGAVRDQRVHDRFHCVDALELDQPFGPEARAILLHLVFSHQVMVPAGQSYNRLVTDLVLAVSAAAGTDVRAALVSASRRVSRGALLPIIGAGLPGSGAAAAHGSLGKSQREGLASGRSALPPGIPARAR
jgi:hypothetical protein